MSSAERLTQASAGKLFKPSGYLLSLALIYYNTRNQLVKELWWLTTWITLGYGFWEVSFQYTPWGKDSQGIGVDG